MNKHKIIMNVDFDDEVCFRREPITVADIKEMLGRCKAMGVDTVIWRFSVGGRVHYHSNVSDRVDVPVDIADIKQAGESGLWFTKPAGPSRAYGDKEDYTNRRCVTANKARVILSNYDPLQVAREFTTELGLDLYIWLDMFDEYHPGLCSRFLRENPRLRWLSRDGKRYFEGLRAYGFSECVENQLDVLRELAAYEPEGIYFSSSCHSRFKDRTGEWKESGFEEPVVARYRERYGIDIREQPFDMEKWHRIKGEFITEFFVEAKKVLDPCGIKLMLPAPIGDHVMWDYPLWSGRSVAEFYCDWRTWADRGIADSLVVGEYQPMWRDTRFPHWDVIAKRMGVDASDQREVQLNGLRKAWDWACEKCEVYCHSGWLHGGYSAMEKGEDTAKQSAAVAKQLAAIDHGLQMRPMHGVVHHEMRAFEAAEFFPRLSSKTR